MDAAVVVMEAIEVVREIDAFFAPETLEPENMTLDQLPRLGQEEASGDPVSKRLWFGVFAISDGPMLTLSASFARAPSRVEWRDLAVSLLVLPHLGARSRVSPLNIVSWSEVEAVRVMSGPQPEDFVRFALSIFSLSTSTSISVTYGGDRTKRWNLSNFDAVRIGYSLFF